MAVDVMDLLQIEGIATHLEVGGLENTDIKGFP